MSNKYIFNYNKINNFLSPNYVKSIIDISNNNKDKIIEYRNNISNIINKKDFRLLIICGPCSIHNKNEILYYANLLKEISLEVEDYLYIVMRTYFEKPRTSIGWKGFINDPELDNTNNIEKGIIESRKLLIDIFNIGIPTGTELLNPLIINYIGDLLSWISIGARTSESQIHREICSSINIPVGFKNNIDGNVLSAINSIKVSSSSQTFLNINDDGYISLIESKGNNNCHIVLRGGITPNYYPENINEYIKLLNNENIKSTFTIDCSHNNSEKNYLNQKYVVDSIINQIKNGNHYINGLMLESNINEGNQKISSNLKYGISVTDSCIGWEETKKLIYKIYNEYKNYILEI